MNLTSLLHICIVSKISFMAAMIIMYVLTVYAGISHGFMTLKKWAWNAIILAAMIFCLIWEIILAGGCW